MEEVKVSSWEGFKDTVIDIKKVYNDTSRGEAHEIKNGIFFRGQSNSSWLLETTLERRSKSEYHSVADYLRMATRYAKEIESFTGNKWDLPRFSIFEKEVFDILPGFHSIPCYEYLLYLRHFGFPSPLLDWTKSPFIAAFFAFEDKGNIEADRSIYVYTCRPKIVDVGLPGVNIHGPYVSTHKRHFSQQALYTTSTKFDSAEKRHIFTSHKAAFAQNTKYQDNICEIVLPGSLRGEVLTELADYNVNKFTVLHSEDALIDSIAMKVFDLD